MGLRVLVVGDEEEAAEAIQDRLEVYGFSVTTAGTGFQALTRLSMEKFEGIFLSVESPEMEQILEDIRTRDRKTPIIVITSAHHDAAVDAVAKGATEYLLKPFDWEELKSKLEKVYSITL